MAVELLRGSAERGNALRAGVILIGGSSTRMGTDKSSLVLNGQTMLERTISALGSLVGEILIVGKPGILPSSPDMSNPALGASVSSSSVLGLKPDVDLGALLGGGSMVAEGISAASGTLGSGGSRGTERGAQSASLNIRRVPDRWPGEGPLGGILSAFAATTAMEILVVAVDLPWLCVGSLQSLCAAPMLLTPSSSVADELESPKHTATRKAGRIRLKAKVNLAEADCVMTLHQNRLQPLHARYTRRCQALLMPQFAAGERSILRCKLAMGTYVAADEDRSSVDVDTPEEWGRVTQY